jgi:hypothetical protein
LIAVGGDHDVKALMDQHSAEHFEQLGVVDHDQDRWQRLSCDVDVVRII